MKNKNEYYEALKWIRDNNGIITFSKSILDGKSLCMIEVNGVRSATNKFFESLDNVKKELKRRRK